LSNKGVHSPVIMNFRANDRSVLLEKLRATASGIARMHAEEYP